MNVTRQGLRRFGRGAGAQTRSAADYCYSISRAGSS